MRSGAGAATDGEFFTDPDEATGSDAGGGSGGGGGGPPKF